MTETAPNGGPMPPPGLEWLGRVYAPGDEIPAGHPEEDPAECCEQHCYPGGLCTWMVGHAGQHVAADEDGHVVGVAWPNQVPEPPARLEVWRVLRDEMGKRLPPLLGDGTVSSYVCDAAAEAALDTLIEHRWLQVCDDEGGQE